MRANPSGPRGASSGDVPPPPSSKGADVAKTSGVVAGDVPPPTTLDDSNIRRTLDHVLTIQVAQGQILVDVLDEIRGLGTNLVQFRISSSPPPFGSTFESFYTCGVALVLVFVFKGRVYFCWLELVELL